MCAFNSSPINAIKDLLGKASGYKTTKDKLERVIAMDSLFDGLHYSQGGYGQTASTKRGNDYTLTNFLTNDSLEYPRLLSREYNMELFADAAMSSGIGAYSGLVVDGFRGRKDVKENGSAAPIGYLGGGIAGLIGGTLNMRRIATNMLNSSTELHSKMFNAALSRNGAHSDTYFNELESRLKSGTRTRIFGGGQVLSDMPKEQLETARNLKFNGSTVQEAINNRRNSTTHTANTSPFKALT